jgi:hypothetical protein
MSGIGLDRRSLLAAGPLLLAAIAAGDKTGNLGEIKLAPPPEAGPDPSETFIQNYQNTSLSHGVTCRHTAAKWPCCTEISTLRVHIW